MANHWIKWYRVFFYQGGGRGGGVETNHKISLFLTHLKERAEIKRKTETEEFISGICGGGSELPEVKRAGNAGHTVTLV